MACGLIRAARPTTSTLMPKNTATRATPIRAPYSPLVPTSTALTATMITAAAAVIRPARRTMMAYFASIYLAPEGSPAPAQARAGVPRFCREPGTAPWSRCGYPVGFRKRITRLCFAVEGPARETYHKVLDPVFTLSLENYDQLEGGVEIRRAESRSRPGRWSAR